MENSNENFADVRIKHGIIRGKVNESGNGKRKFYSFTGIPYASPPTGELRFRDPQPPKCWVNIRNVTDNDDAAFSQFNVPTGKIIGTEELLLNVYTPAIPKRSNKLLPVIVNIPYGAFFWGSGSRNDMGPEYFMDKNVVYISCNYRLGVFGFLCLDTPECPGNFGLKDQVFALKWVKDNVQVFGGNPNNVTIVGASAGGASVHFQLLSEMSSGLFHKAIIISGSAINQWSIQRNPVKVAFHLLKLLGYEYIKVEDILPVLRSLPIEEIIRTFITIPPFTEDMFLPFTPVIEKKFEGVDAFLTVDPLYSMLKGHFKNIPTIIGFCERESLGLRYMLPQHYKDLEHDQSPEKYIKSNFDTNESDNVRQKVLDTYKIHGQEVYLEFLGDLDITSGVLVTTKYLKNYNPNVYAYRFAYDGGFKYFSYLMGIDLLDGVTHIDDLGYLVTAKFLPRKSDCNNDIIVRERMVRLWTNFALCGNPTPVLDDIIDIKWTHVGEKEYNCLDIRSDMKMLKNPFENRRNFWDFIYSFYEKSCLSK